MIRWLISAALAAALASPAWAANVEVDLEQKRIDVCIGVTGDMNKCRLMHMSEPDAIGLALASIAECQKLKAMPDYSYNLSYCPKSLAYIRQRWGY